MRKGTKRQSLDEDARGGALFCDTTPFMKPAQEGELPEHSRRVSDDDLLAQAVNWGVLPIMRGGRMADMPKLRSTTGTPIAVGGRFGFGRKVAVLLDLIRAGVTIRK